MVAPKSCGMHCAAVSCNSNHYKKKNYGRVILLPSTLNGHVKIATDSLIRLLGGTTAKWSQIGAALMFLSHTPSLIIHSQHAANIQYTLVFIGIGHIPCIMWHYGK